MERRFETGNHGDQSGSTGTNLTNEQKLEKLHAIAAQDKERWQLAHRVQAGSSSSVTDASSALQTDKQEASQASLQKQLNDEWICAIKDHADKNASRENMTKEAYITDLKEYIRNHPEQFFLNNHILMLRGRGGTNDHQQHQLDQRAQQLREQRDQLTYQINQYNVQVQQYDDRQRELNQQLQQLRQEKQEIDQRLGRRREPLGEIYLADTPEHGQLVHDRRQIELQEQDIAQQAHQHSQQQQQLAQREQELRQQAQELRQQWDQYNIEATS